MATRATLQDYRDDLDGRLSAAKTSGFWTQAFKDLAINDAGKQVCNAYRWGFLELALKTQTHDDKEYYDYPDENTIPFTEDSIYQINIAGEEYGSNDGRTRKPWGEFQKRKNAGNDAELIFANHDTFYFLYPVPANGLEMDLFGLRKWATLANPTDSSITPPELDDAVVKLALAKCFRKAKKYDEAKAELVEVLDPQVGILAMIWAKTNEESSSGYKGQATSSRWDTPGN